MTNIGDMEKRIAEECDDIKNMLLAKNASYGNSAAEPIHIFSKASALQQIHVRIDDKLKRLKNGNEYGKDDTSFDLIGYLILERIVASYDEVKVSV